MMHSYTCTHEFHGVDQSMHVSYWLNLVVQDQVSHFGAEE